MQQGNQQPPAEQHLSAKQRKKRRQKIKRAAKRAEAAARGGSFASSTLTVRTPAGPTRAIRNARAQKFARASQGPNRLAVSTERFFQLQQPSATAQPRPNGKEAAELEASITKTVHNDLVSGSLGLDGGTAGPASPLARRLLPTAGGASPSPSEAHAQGSPPQRWQSG